MLPELTRRAPRLEPRLAGQRRGGQRSYLVPSVQRAMLMLQQLAGHPEGRTLGELSRLLDIPKSTAHGILVRGARALATLAPYADEMFVYPGQPIPKDAGRYALAFSVPIDCVTTTDTTIGSSCPVNTTMNAVIPGLVKAGKTAVVQLHQVQVFPGKRDALLFRRPGWFARLSRRGFL